MYILHKIYIISGPSAHFENEWVGYEDRESVYAKGKYITGNGYGGATMWTIDLDDFQNLCCSESFPLLKTINRALGACYINIFVSIVLYSSTIHFITSYHYILYYYMLICLLLHILLLF